MRKGVESAPPPFLDKAMSPHTQQSFDVDLNHLVTQVTQLGHACLAQITDAICGLDQADQVMINAVLARHEPILALEAEISALCTRIIARRQPAAVDLRLVMGSFKMAMGLYRICVSACDVAKTGSAILSRSAEVPDVQLGSTGRTIAGMLSRLMAAYGAMNPGNLGRDLDRKSRTVSGVLEGRFRELVTIMISDPKATPASLDIMFVIRAIEAMSGQICEMLPYIDLIAAGTANDADLNEEVAA